MMHLPRVSLRSPRLQSEAVMWRRSPQPSPRRLPGPVPDRQHQFYQHQDGTIRFRRCERFDGGPVDPNGAVFIDDVEVGRAGRRLVYS
jgi:hypothetical protein